MHKTISFSKKTTAILICSTVFCAMLFAPQPAQAGYLDPGSGSTAVQWIIAGIASLGRIKRQFSDTLSKVFGK